MVTTLLNTASFLLESGQTSGALHELMDGLATVRSAGPPESWHTTVEQCRTHKVLRQLHEDPLTVRCFDKPRGFSGDAVTIDMIYDGLLPDAARVSAAGGEVFRSLVDTAVAAKAVRNRRTVIASHIDRHFRSSGGRILSIAGGHLREIELSVAQTRGQIANWVSLDSDALAVEHCRRRYGDGVVQPTHGSVRQLLAGKLDLGMFDFIYSTGLFDYLNDRVALALIQRVLELLNPGGTLLIANFAPALPDAGYMEAFMDWWLIYRTEQDLLNLFAALKAGPEFTAQGFSDGWNAISYQSITRQ